MGVNKVIFADIPNYYWHTGIDAKVKGTWNLYNTLQLSCQVLQLDFFLLTSSVSGSVGTAAESNYCADNHFLDLFAGYLRSQGLPAVSIGIGMIPEVGYLHDNPDGIIGAEFRTWLYQNLMAEIPLSMLLGTTCHIKDLKEHSADWVGGTCVRMT